MEVTTVSPSPASPTEWDNLCEIDVSNMAIHSVTLLFSLCGLVGNGAVLCLISLKEANIVIFGLALVDVLFLLFTVPSALLLLVEDVSCSPILPLPFLSFLFQSSVVYYLVILCLMFILSTAYMHRLCKLCCHCRLTKCLQWLLVLVQLLAISALIIAIPVVAWQCPSHKQQQCRAALISMYAVILLLCIVPTVISLTIYFIQAKRGSTEQQPKTGNIVISFLVLFLVPLSLCCFLQQLGYILVSSEVIFLLNCIHSSIKPFIYFLAGRCWRRCSMQSLRLSLQRIFEEPEIVTALSSSSAMDTVL